MRDIKFRVWDKETKHMHICGEDVHDTINFEIETNRAYYYNLQNGCGSLREDSNYVLMQYTGLKDKNGKEIYEGDIIKICAEGLGGEAIGKIVYDEYDLAFVLKNEVEELSECLWYAEQQLEVIGNIYDNPELLKEGE